MSKATLKFDITEEDYELRCAIMGKEAILALWDIQEKLRGKIKWFPEEKDQKILEGLEEAQQLIYDKMFEYDILGLVNANP